MHTDIGMRNEMTIRRISWAGLARSTDMCNVSEVVGYAPNWRDVEIQTVTRAKHEGRTSDIGGDWMERSHLDPGRSPSMVEAKRCRRPGRPPGNEVR